MKNFKRIIKLIFLILITTITFNTLTLQKNSQLVPQLSLLEKQSQLEKQFNSSNYTIDKPNIIVDPYDISPLTALIIFETNEKLSPTITIKGKNKTSKDLTFTFKENKKHFLPIYGLYADYTNQVKIVLDNQTYNFIIKTEKLPKDFNNVVDITLIDEYKYLVEDHFYFLTTASSGYTKAYDIEGEVRWYLTENLVWEIKRLKNNNLIVSNEKLINPPYYTTGLYEIDLLGKIYKEYIFDGGYHHDVYEMNNSNLLVASNNFSDDTVEDFLVEIDRDTGKIVKSIDLKTILEVNEGKSENWINYDWFHNNSVYLDEETNELLLSGRHQDIVVNIDYNTLKINYIIGNPDGFSSEYQKYFLTPINDLEWPYSQHAAKFLPNKNIMIFDNGNNRAKDKSEYIEASKNYSRGVIYEVDKDNMTIKQVYQYGKERLSEYYSPYISDVDYLNKEHYLIHSGGHASYQNQVLNQPPGLTEYDKLRSYTSEIYNDKLIFELVLDDNNYRAEKMLPYLNTTNLKLEQGQYLADISKTEIDKETTLIPFLIFNDKNNEYDIKVEKEKDRLVVSGNFTNNESVEIILYKNFKALHYNLRVSSRPYSAMCLDIFNEDQINVKKYINDISLDGEYKILLKINNKIYNSNYQVKYNPFVFLTQNN